MLDLSGLKANVSSHAKRDLTGIAKSIDRGQAARSAQSDHDPYFSPFADFLCTNPFQHDKFSTLPN